MVTIKDVAAKAGVNPSTVSRVLKDNASISSKTKERVKKLWKSWAMFLMLQHKCWLVV